MVKNETHLWKKTSSAQIIQENNFRWNSDFLEFAKYKVDHSALIYHKFILPFYLLATIWLQLFNTVAHITESNSFCPSNFPLYSILLQKIKQLIPDWGVKAILFTQSFIIVGKISCFIWVAVNVKVWNKFLAI